MIELTLVMVKALGDKRDEVEIREVEGDFTVIFYAMRSILNSTATKFKKRVVFEIVE